MGKRKEESTALAIVPRWTEEQADSLNGLHSAMGNFFDSVLACHSTGIPLADAFAAIGVEIPKMLQPMINTLADKLPARES